MMIVMTILLLLLDWYDVNDIDDHDVVMAINDYETNNNLMRWLHTYGDVDEQYDHNDYD